MKKVDTPSKLKFVYQIKITLDHSKPPIWRKFLVSSDIKLPDLHNVIQAVMGWSNSHLHQFVINKEFYAEPDEEAIDSIDYRKIKLDTLINKEKQKFIYEYDFGDSWTHTLVLEKILPHDSKVKYPVCISGKRACPPEDCGGIYGYEELLEIISDPGHEEYEERLDWLDESFDPEEFDIDGTNAILQMKGSKRTWVRDV